MPTPLCRNASTPLHHHKTDDVSDADLHRIQQVGNTSADDLYGLTQQDFEKLFTDSATTGNCADPAAALLPLKENILNTDNKIIRDNCIDLLHNIVLRNDVFGYEAEKILVELFTQSPPDSASNIEISEQIAATSLELVTMQQPSPSQSLLSKADRLVRPSALLCMALAHPTVTKIKEETKEHIINTIKTLDPDETSAILWDRGRFISESELVTSGAEMNGKYNRTIHINLPKPLINPHTNDPSEENILSAALRNKQQKNELNQLEKVAELFTLNTMIMKQNDQGHLRATKEHWVLAALYRESRKEAIKRAVFSSTPLDEVYKTHFTDSIELLSGSRENITFIDDNLQEYIPNGCGAFADRAAERIGQEYGHNKNISQILQGFAVQMKESSKHELEQFNTVWRGKLLTGRYLEQNKS